eukprot:6017848-Pyramimonas_sp.AAC.1
MRSVEEKLNGVVQRYEERNQTMVQQKPLIIELASELDNSKMVALLRQSTCKVQVEPGQTAKWTLSSHLGRLVH